MVRRVIVWGLLACLVAAIATAVYFCDRVDPNDPGPAGWPYVSAYGRTVYHTRSCGHVRKILPKNRVYYRSHAHARDNGQRPCRHCLSRAARPPRGLPRRTSMPVTRPVEAP